MNNTKRKIMLANDLSTIYHNYYQRIAPKIKELNTISRETHKLIEAADRVYVDEGSVTIEEFSDLSRGLHEEVGRQCIDHIESPILVGLFQRCVIELFKLDERGNG